MVKTEKTKKRMESGSHQGGRASERIADSDVGRKGIRPPENGHVLNDRKTGQGGGGRDWKWKGKDKITEGTGFVLLVQMQIALGVAHRVVMQVGIVPAADGIGRDKPDQQGQGNDAPPCRGQIHQDKDTRKRALLFTTGPFFRFY